MAIRAVIVAQGACAGQSEAGREEVVWREESALAGEAALPIQEVEEHDGDERLMGGHLNVKS
jgi:hypothetical protein